MYDKYPQCQPVKSQENLVILKESVAISTGTVVMCREGM